MSEFIFDRRWFYRLVEGDECLLSQVSRSSLYGHLVVCFIDPKGNRLYSLFDSHLDFIEYEQKIPPEKRTFFEIIPGENPQKPHFDIDVKGDSVNVGEKTKDLLVERILTVLGPLDLSRDLLLFTSHGETKRSYHLVIDNYFHRDHDDAKAFYQRVIEEIPPPYRDLIDPAVYSSMQQFRMVGSQKLGSGRPKIHATTWSFKGAPINYRYPEPVENDRHRHIIEISVGLVSNTSYCRPFPLFKKIEPKPVFSDGIEATGEELKGGFEMFKKWWPRGGFPFRVLRTDGGRIDLKRKFPAHCPQCDRVHDSENAFLSILGKERSVFFFCRRSERGKGIYIGSMKEIQSYLEDDPIESPAPLDPIPLTEDTMNILTKLGKKNKGDPKKKKEASDVAVHSKKDPRFTGDLNDSIP